MDGDREQGELRHLPLLESREYLFLERREHNHPTELTARNHHITSRSGRATLSYKARDVDVLFPFESLTVVEKRVTITR